MKIMGTDKRGFTFIELLVVFGIIIILAIVMILILNPWQFAAQARDQERSTGLTLLTQSISLYHELQPNMSLGSANVTYVSIPDPTATTTAGTDCSGLGFPSGGSFHCAASSTFTNVNGTGWIPINLSTASSGALLATLPVDPVNTTSSNFYYTYQTDGTTFKIRAVPEAQKTLPQAGNNQNFFTFGSNLNLGGGAGWVLVPGNSTLGTNNFWMMKYDATCSDGNGNIFDTPVDRNGYDNASTSCTIANGRQIASLGGGIPIVDISQISSTAYCASVGAHLLTNNEWQTIAWNAEDQGSNWSGGIVGSGSVYSGHNDDNPAQESAPASVNDAMGYVGTDGPVSGGGNGAGGSSAQNQFRTFVLSDGAVIWDMAGNVWQWINNTITGATAPNAGTFPFTWIEFPSVTTWGSMTQQTVGPANPAWNSSQGIGKMDSEDATLSGTYGLLRGCDWNCNSVSGAAGVESLTINVSPTSTENAISAFGFRCAQ